MLALHLCPCNSDGLMVIADDLSGLISELSSGTQCEWANSAWDQRPPHRPPARTQNTHSWKTNVQTHTKRNKSLYRHKALHTHVEKRHRNKNRQTHKTPAKNSNTPVCCNARTNTHSRNVRVCVQMCKNNKANLVKGVGGEAARQKDINSLSEFNNRGGGGSRDKNEEEEKKRESTGMERKTKRQSYKELKEGKRCRKIGTFG